MDPIQDRASARQPFEYSTNGGMTWDHAPAEGITIAGNGKVIVRFLGAALAQPVAPASELIELLTAIKPNYGDVGTRDVEVTAQRARIERAIELLSVAAPQVEVAAQAEHSRFGSPELQARILANLAQAEQVAKAEPTAWMCPAAVEPEFTDDALLAGYWMRKGRTVTPLYAQPSSNESSERAAAPADWRVACRQSKGGCGAAGRMTFDGGTTATAEWNRRTATEPATAAPSQIKTWQERLLEAEPQWKGWPLEGSAIFEAGNSYKEEEIADLRAALASAEAKLKEKS